MPAYASPGKFTLCGATWWLRPGDVWCLSATERHPTCPFDKHLWMGSHKRIDRGTLLLEQCLYPFRTGGQTSPPRKPLNPIPVSSSVVMSMQPLRSTNHRKLGVSATKQAVGASACSPWSPLAVPQVFRRLGSGSILVWNASPPYTLCFVHCLVVPCSVFSVRLVVPPAGEGSGHHHWLLSRCSNTVRTPY